MVQKEFKKNLDYLFCTCFFVALLKHKLNQSQSRVVARIDAKILGHALLPPENTTAKRILFVFLGFEIFQFILYHVSSILLFDI